MTYFRRIVESPTEENVIALIRHVEFVSSGGFLSYEELKALLNDELPVKFTAAEKDVMSFMNRSLGYTTLLKQHSNVYFQGGSAPTVRYQGPEPFDGVHRDCAIKLWEVLQ